MLKVVFAGTPEFAKDALSAICDAGFEVPLVMTQPDRPAGRGMHLQESPVKQFAKVKGIRVIQPTSLKLNGKYPDEAKAAMQTLASIDFDVLVVAAYGLILPQEVFDVASQNNRHGCLNIHASLLPRWRGAAPIQRAIEAGDSKTGISIMQMDLGLDTGDVLALQSLEIQNTETASSLHDRLAKLGSEMIVDVLKSLVDKKPLHREPQSEVDVVYANKILKEEARINWSLPAINIDRRIRAFNPFPGCAFEYKGQLLKVWMSKLSGLPASSKFGEIIAVDKTGVTVSTGSGTVTLTELQKPGGKRGPALQVCQSLAVLPGEIFL
jgi:methionyl-tRNA formyltransferase